MSAHTPSDRLECTLTQDQKASATWNKRRFLKTGGTAGQTPCRKAPTPCSGRLGPEEKAAQATAIAPGLARPRGRVNHHLDPAQPRAPELAGPLHPHMREVHLDPLGVPRLVTTAVVPRTSRRPAEAPSGPVRPPRRDTPRPVAEARGPCDTIQRAPNSRGVSRSSSGNSAARTSGLIIRAPPTDGKRGGLHYIDSSDHHEFDLIMAKCNIVVGSLGSH